MDLSYILNSPDVERVATALETIADKYGDTIPSSVKVALLQCFQHVAWADDKGQACYDALYEALNGGEPPVDPTIFSYTPEDGLLSAQDYCTKTTTAGYATGVEKVENDELVLIDQKPSGFSGNTVSTTYSFETASNPKLTARFKCVSARTYTSTPGTMGFNISVGDGAHRCRAFFVGVQNDDNIYVVFYDATGNQSIRTNFKLSDYHTAELSLVDGHACLTIDGVIVAETDTPVEWTGGSSVINHADVQIVETHITSIEYSEVQ